MGDSSGVSLFYGRICWGLGAEMGKDVQDFIDKLENMVRRLAHVNKDGFVDAMHLIEVYSEIADIMIAFDIEQYQETSEDDESSEGD